MVSCVLNLPKDFGQRTRQFRERDFLESFFLSGGRMMPLVRAKIVFVKYKQRCAYERVANYLELPNNLTTNS